MQGDVMSNPVKICSPGECPLCGKQIADYPDEPEIDGESLSYKVTCSCGFVGYEVYSVEFTHFALENGSPVREDGEEIE